jgi:hypothetical protein
MVGEMVLVLQPIIMAVACHMAEGLVLLLLVVVWVVAGEMVLLVMTLVLAMVWAGVLGFKVVVVVY